MKAALCKNTSLYLQAKSQQDRVPSSRVAAQASPFRTLFLGMELGMVHRYILQLCNTFWMFAKAEAPDESHSLYLN